MDRILPTSHLLEKIHFNIDEQSTDDIETKDVQQGVLEFYRRFSDISLPKFHISTDTQKHTAKSFFVSTKETRDQIPINFQETEHHIIEYDLDVLNRIVTDDVYSDSYYNNTKISPIIEDGRVKSRKTDYYTNTTLSALLRMEAAIANSTESPELQDYSLRNEVLGTKNHFLYPSRPLLGAGRGTICVKRPDGEYILLLGRRADYVDAASNMISSFPAGTIEEYGAENPVKTVKREFLEEFFLNEPDIGQSVMDELNFERTSSGWNARSGDMLFDYIIYSHDPEVYTDIIEKHDGNGELSEIVEIPVQDREKLADILQVGEISGDAVHAICYVLKYIDESEDFPSLDYTIEVDWN